MSNPTVPQEKLLPQNVEAEAGVLGSLLIDPEVMGDVRNTGLKAADFYKEANRLIYEAVADLFEDDQPFDLIMVLDELERRGHLEDVGGSGYVSSLANQVPTSANAAYYAQIVLRCAINRAMIHAAGQIAAVAYNEPDAQVMCEQALRLVMKVTQRQSGAVFRPFSHWLKDLQTETAARVDNLRGTLLRTGLRELDDAIIGWEPSDLVVLAARPGGLKSTLGIQITKNFANQFRLQEGGVAAYLTLEMSAVQQARRLIAGELQQDSRVIKAGFRDPAHLDQDPDEEAYARFVTVVAERAEQWGPHLHMSQEPMSVDALGLYLTQLKAECDLRVVVVDQLDLFDDDRRLEEHAAVSHAIKQLKVIARRLGIVVIALCQLNRAVEKQANHRATLSNLRMSGRLEQDSDFIIFLHRPTLWDKTRTDANFLVYMDVTLAKARGDIVNGRHIPLMVADSFSEITDWPHGSLPLPDLFETADGDDDQPVPTAGKNGHGKRPMPPPGGGSPADWTRWQDNPAYSQGLSDNDDD